MANRGPGRNVVCIGRYACNEIDSNKRKCYSGGQRKPQYSGGRGVRQLPVFRGAVVKSKDEASTQAMDGLQAMWVARWCQEIGSIHCDDQRNPVSTYKD